MQKLTLKEAVIRDPELGEAVWKDEFEAKAVRNPVYKQLIKEGLFSDVAGALGAVQDVVWAAAWPQTIGREIIAVVGTKNALERFPKEIRPYAFVTGEGPAPGTGRRAEMQDVKADMELACKQEWTEMYAEDASWNVLAHQLEGVGKALARLETEKIVAAYNAIAAGSLAGGAEVTVTDGAPTWAQVAALVKTVEKEDFYPSVIAMNPDEFGGLWALDQFVHALYLDHANVKRRAIYHTTLDIIFVCSSLVTKTLCIDTKAAAVMLLRRDVTTKPYEDPGRNVYGVQATERIGVGVLRTKAVARGTN